MTKQEIQEDVINTIAQNNYKGIVLLPTGSGKAKILIEIAKILDPESILYLCDNKDLRDVTFKEEMVKWGGEHLIDRTTFSCYQSAYKLENSSFALGLYDEFDFALSPEYSKVFINIKCDNYVYTSATLDNDKRKLAESFAPIIYEKKFEDFVKDKVLNNVQYYKVSYNMTPSENYKYLSYNKSFKTLLNGERTPAVNKKLNFLKIQRKQFLSTLTNGANATRYIADNVKDKNGGTIIFCGLTEQADRISPYSYHSKSEKDDLIERFNKGEIPEIAVVEKITRGINLNNVRYIIHESIGTNKTKIEQKTGRGMRLSSDDTLSVFFLVPRFKHPFFGWKDTVVNDWMEKATRDMKVDNLKQINYYEE